MNVGVRVFDGVAHARLRAQVHHTLKISRTEQRIQRPRDPPDPLSHEFKGL